LFLLNYYLIPFENVVANHGANGHIVQHRWQLYKFYLVLALEEKILEQKF